MNSTAFNTLLALLLALKSPKVSLSSLEQSNLFEVGEQLELDPDDWEFIEEGLMAIITSNDALNAAFQSAHSSLLTVAEKVRQQLLPTDEEVTQVLFERKIEIRGDDRDFANRKIVEKVIQIAIKVLKDDNPQKKIGSLRWIDRVVKVLGQ
ncbi:hypothetical protein [Kamptonema formosum]|uniref:hypothetical protein n=1 Tax=Kamptonema formosum TaxID=331992 RepID=UPI0003819ACD|nr:hypothetical protein [Oscillatoria sp. PCC 10802]